MNRDRAYLRDILVASRLAVSYLTATTREAFEQDSLRQDAVIRRLEIVGEAARRVSEATRLALPDLPWHDMIGMRNVVIHRYDEVDMGIVWDTVKRDLPEVIARLEQVLGGEADPSEPSS